MRRFLKFLLIKVPLALFILSVLWVLILKIVPVWVTPLMVLRYFQNGGPIEKQWTRLENISDEMVFCVVAAEDNRFFEHNGFDRVEIQKAIEDHRDKGKKLRGASTISQQTAKNVFLLPTHSFVRKTIEAYFTVLIEWIWGKERIMEVYLNVAEMGKGIYGAEAAAQQYFDHGADKLTRREASLITACLPSPLKRHPENPSKYVSSRAARIRTLVKQLGLKTPLFDSD